MEEAEGRGVVEEKERVGEREEEEEKRLVADDEGKD